jgi:two-component system capsular synthesis sensor histidine kinase RcsC
MLENHGHRAMVVSSGEEALRVLAQQAFDVIVSDVGLGAGMNGWELAEQVRERWPEVGFALATGWGGSIELAEARRQGVRAVASKPYLVADLLAAVQTTLSPARDETPSSD